MIRSKSWLTLFSVAPGRRMEETRTCARRCASTPDPVSERRKAGLLRIAPVGEHFYTDTAGSTGRSC